MLSQGGIGVCLKLGVKGRMLVWGDSWQASGRRLGSKVKAVTLLRKPAFERATTDGEGGNHVLAGRAASNCRENAVA